jgi:hypothetical protein
MTVSEHLERNSFAYVVPPDCAEGQPLTSVKKPRTQPRVKRAWRRVVSRKR